MKSNFLFFLLGFFGMIVILFATQPNPTNKANSIQLAPTATIFKK
jgi:hypothetical protein